MIGDTTEMALAEFIFNQEGVDKLRLGLSEINEKQKLRLRLPFDYVNKTKITIRDDPEDEDMLNVYVQGAPKRVLNAEDELPDSFT